MINKNRTVHVIELKKNERKKGEKKKTCELLINCEEATRRKGCWSMYKHALIRIAHDDRTESWLSVYPLVSFLYQNSETCILKFAIWWLLRACNVMYNLTSNFLKCHFKNKFIISRLFFTFIIALCNYYATWQFE